MEPKLNQVEVRKRKLLYIVSGRASARETAVRVAAGAIAEKILKDKLGTNVVSWVTSVGDIAIPQEVLNEYC
mgnify:CR=1 FL=1